MGNFFKCTTLFHLSAFVQLRHEAPSPCAAPSFTKLTIIHLNGVHHVCAVFCTCSQSDGTHAWQQLMRQQWYPATLDKPRTCSTFSILNMFHKLTLEGKSTTFDFYSTLEKLMNNLFVSFSAGQHWMSTLNTGAWYESVSHLHFVSRDRPREHRH